MFTVLGQKISYWKRGGGKNIIFLGNIHTCKKLYTGLLPPGETVAQIGGVRDIHEGPVKETKSSRTVKEPEISHGGREKGLAGVAKSGSKGVENPEDAFKGGWVHGTELLIMKRVTKLFSFAI